MAYSKFTPSNAVVPGDTQTGTDSSSIHEFTGSVFISGTLSASQIVGGTGTTPGGANTNIQYNDGGAFGGDANLTWDKAGQTLTVSGDVTASANVSASAFYGDGSNLSNIPAGSPAGADTQIQYNNGGAFGADANFVWDDTGQVLNVTGDITASANISASSEIAASTLLGSEVQFNIDHVATGHTTGRLYWGDDDKTLTLDMQGTDVKLQIGQEQHIYVRNSSGVDIDNGDAVRISGASGTNIEVEKAISEIKSFTALTEQDTNLGLATEAITAGQSGYVTTYGQVRDVDTSGFSEGDILYLSHTVSGSLVNVRPPAPYFPAKVGIVEVVNATTGIILVRPVEPTFLTDIAQITGSDVPTNVPSYLCYDDTTQIVTFTNELSGSYSGSFEGDGAALENLSAAGADTQLQYNNAGAFGADANLTWDDTGQLLTVLGDVTASVNVSASAFYGDGSNLTNISAGPAGADTQIQYNNAGLLGGDANFTWNDTAQEFNVTGSTHFDGKFTSTVNSTKVVQVASSSDLPATLAANTTYQIRGQVDYTTPIAVTNAGCSLIGQDRNVDRLVYNGVSGSAGITVTDQDFELRNLYLSSSIDGAVMFSGSNYDAAGFNSGRDKVLTIFNCQFRGTWDVAEITGFDLVDINNTLFWYIKAQNHGVRFLNTSKIEVSSCEFIRWFDETTIPAPSGYATVPMVELRSNAGGSGIGAVNINGSLLHPQQTQDGIKINAGSTTGFGTIGVNTFIDVNLTTGLKFFPDPSTGGYSNTECLNYNIQNNQGVPDSTAYGMGFFTGSVTGNNDTAYTLVDVQSLFQDLESQRFTVANNGEMTYNGTQDILVTINATLSVVAEDASMEVEVGLFKSGSTSGNNFLTGSSAIGTFRQVDEGVALPTTFTTNLSSGEKIGVYAKTDDATHAYTLRALQLSIKE